MSRSDKSTNRTPHPCERWFEWSSTHQTLTYWDSEAKENVPVKMPFRFLVLDQLNTVTGYSKSLNAGFYANEVRGSKDEITVRSKKLGIIKTGEWKADLKSIDGAAFTKSVYIAYYDADGEMRLGNIKFAGSALSGLSDNAIKANLAAHKKDKTVELYPDELFTRIGWFNFCEVNKDIEDIAVELCDSIPDKNGTVDFHRPIFKRVEKVSEESLQKALELDRILQPYLKEYLAQNKAHAETGEADHGEAQTGEDYIENQNADIERSNMDTPDFSADVEEVPFMSNGELLTAKQLSGLQNLCDTKNLDSKKIARHYSGNRCDTLEDLTQVEAGKALVEIPGTVKKSEPAAEPEPATETAPTTINTAQLESIINLCDGKGLDRSEMAEHFSDERTDALEELTFEEAKLAIRSIPKM